MKHFRIPAFALLLLLALSLSLHAADAIGWRGDGSGKYPTANPSTTWSTTQTVVWSTSIDAWSNATPVVVGKKVFTEAEPSDLICLSAQDGKVLWRKPNPVEDAYSPEQKAEYLANKPAVDSLKAEIEKIEKQINDLKEQRKANPSDASLKEKQDALSKSRKELSDKLSTLGNLDVAPTHPVNGYSSPTPISDGKNIYVLFGSGVAACYDFDGNRKWIKFVEKPSSPATWGHSSSPRLVEGKLIVHVTDMWALDPATGKVLWQTASPIDWGTAYVTKIGKSSVLVTPMGAVVRASDGKVLAKDLFRMPYGSPIVANNVIFSMDESGAIAIELPKAITDDKITTKTLWQQKPEELPVKQRYYASPIVVDDILYVVSHGNTFAALEPSTGKVIYKKVLDIGNGTVYPSIALAGKYLIVSCDTGISVVLEPGREYKEVARNVLEPFRSTPVFVGDRMYVRTLAKMYCIGK